MSFIRRVRDQIAGKHAEVAVLTNVKGVRERELARARTVGVSRQAGTAERLEAQAASLQATATSLASQAADLRVALAAVPADALAEVTPLRDAA